MQKKGRSHRFARFLGSRHVLQLNVKDKFGVSYPDLKGWLAGHKFVLCGRVFVPFATKESKAGAKIFMVETSEDYDGRKMSEGQGDQYRLSLTEFVNWYNPIELNQEQVRCILNTSRTSDISIVVVECKQIHGTVRSRLVEHRSLSALRAREHLYA